MIIEKAEELTVQYWWLISGSLILLLAFIVLIPLILINLPVDYFASEKSPLRRNKHNLTFIMLEVLKTGIGFIIVCFGVILLFIPGQGLLTIFAGLMCMNIPGKRRLELYIVRKKSILMALNWMRKKAGKQPIVDIFQRN